MKKFDTDYVKNLLIKHKGNRKEVALILGVTKSTVGSWINRKFGLRQFRAIHESEIGTKQLPNCAVTEMLIDNQLKRIRKTGEYLKADARGRTEIEERIRRNMFTEQET